MGSAPAEIYEYQTIVFEGVVDARVNALAVQGWRVISVRQGGYFAADDRYSAIATSVVMERLRPVPPHDPVPVRGKGKGKPHQ